MNKDNTWILILILVIFGIVAVLSRIPQLNPPDMHRREATFKGVVKLFLIAIGIIIVLMAVWMGILFL